jgi:hypothetical protein
VVGNLQRQIKYWLIAIQAAFVGLFVAFSANPVPFEFTRPMAAATILWTIGLWIILFRVLFRSLGQERPARALLPLARAEVPVIVRALEWALLLGLALALHGWAKSMLPQVTSFWADPMLADLDFAIFGTDPWHLFRIDLLGGFYAKTYVVWFPITFGTMALLAFSSRDRTTLFNSYLATLIIGGTIGQYLLPSAGPIFFERIGLGTRFAELVATNNPTYNMLADYLWKYHEAGGAGLGTGISAMPSMHVANAVWTMFAARAIWKPLTVPALLYVLVIWAASIASGWHYMTDGLVGVLVACAAHALMVRLAKRGPSKGVHLVSDVPRPVTA